MKYTATNITGIGDPFVLYDNGTYYMYATHDNNGISVWKGSCPKALQYAGICYRGEHSFGYECFWAPEVVKRADGRFVMHLTARDRRDGVLRTGVAVSDSPEGGFTDAVAGSAMFDIGTATIDASCFIDDDGKGLFNKHNQRHTHKSDICGGAFLRFNKAGKRAGACRRALAGMGNAFASRADCRVD